MRVLGIDKKTHTLTASFGRKPTEAEADDMQNTINKAYNIMGTKERIAITHGSCFPATDKDSCIGSPFSKAANEYIKFLALYGFNGNQLGPNGELVRGNNSPYNSSAFAKNRLFIDLQALQNSDYAEILDEKDIDNLLLTPKHTDKNYTYTDFNKANEIYDNALEKAFIGFRTKLKNGDANALELNKEFQIFLKSNDNKNNKRLTEEGIFNVLVTYKKGEMSYVTLEDVVGNNKVVGAASGNTKESNIRKIKMDDDLIKILDSTECNLVIERIEGTHFGRKDLSGCLDITIYDDYME